MSSNIFDDEGSRFRFLRELLEGIVYEHLPAVKNNFLLSLYANFA